LRRKYKKEEIGKRQGKEEEEKGKREGEIVK